MTEVERQARRWHQAREREEKERAGLAAVIRSAAEQGLSEMELARQAGKDGRPLNRQTIRRWLGK